MYIGSEQVREGGDECNLQWLASVINVKDTLVPLIYPLRIYKILIICTSLKPLCWRYWCKRAVECKQVIMSTRNDLSPVSSQNVVEQIDEV